MDRVKEATKLIKCAVNDIYNSEADQKRRKDMDLFLSYFTGEHWRKMEKQNELETGIYANFFFATAMNIAPLLTDRLPVWNIMARKPHWQRTAETYKDAGDCLFDALSLPDKTMDLIVDAMIFGMGLWKIHFDPAASGWGEIRLDQTDPRTFGLPDGYTDLWETPWCFTKSRVPVSLLKNRYPQYADKIKPDSGDGEEKDGKDGFCTLYDVWYRSTCDFFDELPYGKSPETEYKKSRKYEKDDYKNGRISVFIDSMEEPLDDRPYPYNHGKPPYVNLYDYKIPHEFWGMGECAQIEGIVLEYNLILKRMCEYLRKWCLNPDIFVEEGGSIDPDSYKKNGPGGGNLYTLSPGGKPPFIATPNSMSPGVFNMINMLPWMLEEITGVTETSKGQVAKKQRQSAREIQTLLETSQTRTRQRIRNLESTYKRAFILIVELMQQYYGPEKRMLPRRTDGGIEWVGVSNNPKVLQEDMKPKPLPNEPTPEEQQEFKQENDDYEQLLKELFALEGDEYKPVYFDFDITIDTNSTLPMDKQSLANTMIQLAGVSIRPETPIDTETFLETLGLPNVKRIIQRKQEEKAALQPPPGPPQGPPGAPPM